MCQTNTGEPIALRKRGMSVDGLSKLDTTNLAAPDHWHREVHRQDDADEDDEEAGYGPLVNRDLVVNDVLGRIEVFEQASDHSLRAEGDLPGIEVGPTMPATKSPARRGSYGGQSLRRP